MSVVDRVRGAINPTKTKAQAAAAEAAELEQHIERTKTERARRVATATDLQRRIGEATERQKLLRARRDLASAYDDVDLLDQELAGLGTLLLELTTELTEAQEAIKRADLVLPDFQQRQKLAAATVVTEQRRENLAEMEAILPELEAAYRVVIEIQRRAYIVGSRDDTLRSNPAVALKDGTAPPPLFGPLGFLGPDLSHTTDQMRQFRVQMRTL